MSKRSDRRARGRRRKIVQAPQPLPVAAEPKDQARYEGKVKWFSTSKGHGFIQSPMVDRDVFVHYSGINGEGFKNLIQGELVEFSLLNTPKGPQAIELDSLY